jgi:hypothetical protein
MCAAAVVAATFVSVSASADETSSANLDFGKLADAIRTGGEMLFPREGFAARPVTGRREQDIERWVGVTPHLSLVARDWGGVQMLLGGHVALTDQLRLSRSSRMVVSRVRLADGRIAPFAQIGLGQWRVDTDLMPVLPRDTELATQLGGGFELKLAPRWRLALQIDYTVLYREGHEPQQVAGTRLWGSFLGMHAAF